MATLENRAILLSTVQLPLLGTVNIYHRYTIYTKDSGEQWVFRSGPSGSASTNASDISADIIGGTSSDWGNIHFTSQLYRNADGTVPYNVINDRPVFPADSIYNSSGLDPSMEMWHIDQKRISKIL